MARGQGRHPGAHIEPAFKFWPSPIFGGQAYRKWGLENFGGDDLKWLEFPKLKPLEYADQITGVYILPVIWSAYSKDEEAYLKFQPFKIVHPKNFIPSPIFWKLVPRK